MPRSSSTSVLAITLVVGTACTFAACSTTKPPARATPSSTTAMELAPEERRDQPVTDDDLRVLRRADEILSTAAVWNRHDTRVCTPTDTTWSLFCALQKASLEVFGEYRHRAACLQEVRFAVEEVTRGVELAHRMMDYNNLPSTRFEDIKAVLRVATERVSARQGLDGSRPTRRP